MIYTITDEMPGDAPWHNKPLVTYSLDTTNKLVYINFHQEKVFVDQRQNDVGAIFTRQSLHLGDEQFKYKIWSSH